MGQQVITIGPEGQVSGLLHKKGKGFDIRKLGGSAKVERVSLIEWDEREQAWYVNILQEAGRGVLTAAKWGNAVGGHKEPLRARSTSVTEGVYYFDDYDDGVAAEIEYLDALRKRGEF